MATKKSELKNVIEKLKQTHKYFSYEEIKSLLKKENIDLTSQLLKKYLHEFIINEILFDAGKGWYSSIKKPFNLNTKPVKPLIRKIQKEFPLLDSSCWSTEQLNSFTHHLLSKFVIFVYIDSDYIRNLYNFLKDKGYNVYENPRKAEIEKQFTITDKTVIIRPSISKQPKAVCNCSPIEKILVDFLIENNKLTIINKPELENIVKNAVIAGRINISEIYSYATRREFSVFDVVTNS